MFRNSIQLSGKLVRPVFFQDYLSLVKLNYKITKRWAGHSKWSNIKHIKMLKDQSKSATFQRISKKIYWAVKEGGEDLKFNFKLKALVEEAKKVSMPNTTLQNAINSAKLSNEAKPYWLTYKGPGGILIAFEVATVNPNHAMTVLGQYTKKINLKFLKNPGDVWTEKGIIISEPLKDVENGYDKALEDAIEVGIEEVVEDEDKTLVFECVPNKLDIVHKKLVDKGYNIQSASTEIEFQEYVTLTEKDSEILNSVIEKMQNNCEDLLRTSMNVETELK